MKTPRSDFTLGFKREDVRRVQGGQRQSEICVLLGILGPTLHNWVKAEAGTENA